MNKKKELLDNFMFCVKEKAVLYAGNIKIEREIYKIYEKYVEEGLGEYQTPEDFFEAYYQEKQIPEVINLVAEQTSTYQMDEYQDKLSDQIIILIVAFLLIFLTLFPPLGEILLVLSVFEIIFLTIFYLLHSQVEKDFSEQFEGTFIFSFYFFVIFIFMVYYNFFPPLGEILLIIWSFIVIFTIILYLLSLIFPGTKFVLTSTLTFFYLYSVVIPKIKLISILIIIVYLLNYLDSIIG